jgi:hypothetical protein
VSRADPEPVPGVGAALRSAAVDFYYQSIRLVAANVVWGGVLVGFLFLIATGGLLVAFILLPLLAVPFVGVARLAAQIVRQQDVVLSDAWSAWRRFGLVALGSGAAIILLAAILTSNVLFGLSIGGVAGGVLVSFAGWGLALLWLAIFPFWLLLVDPARANWSLRARVKLVGYLLLADPARLFLLGIVLAVILGLAIVLVAALFTIGAAYAALVTARAILPAADRLSVTLGDRFPPLVEPADDSA